MVHQWKHGWTNGKRVIGLQVLIFAILFSASWRAHAEPPSMKEQSVKPKIQAVSPDGRYSVSLGGFLQARYTGILAEGEENTSQFGLARTRMYVFGHVHSKEFRYRLMVGTPPNSQQMKVFDAYVEWEVRNELRIRIGRFKLPIFREWVESARLLASVDRNTLTKLLGPGRDYGTMVSGELFHGQLDYAAGLFNGAGDTATKDSNSSPAMAGRLVWNAMGRSIEGEIDFDNSPPTLAVGVSGYATWRPVDDEPTTDTNVPHMRERMAGAEIAFRYHGFDLTSEIMGRERLRNDIYENVWGGYVRADMYFSKLQSSLGVRGVEFISQTNPRETRHELEIDTGYFVEQHDLKLMANWGIARLPVLRAWERFVFVQAQVSF
jgi:hypothetical protein